MGARTRKTPPGRAATARTGVLRWAVLLPGLALASFAASAALVDLGWSPTPSLIVTGALLAALLVVSLRRTGLLSWSLADWGWTGLATLVVGGVVAGLLYNGAFRGMPALGGGDAGLHVALGRAFLIHEAPGQHGMGAYYTLAHWLDWELWRDRRRPQLAWGLAVLLLGLGLAVYGWHRIATIDTFGASDGIILDEHLPSLAGLTVLSVGTLLVPWCHGERCSDATRRLARFVGLFGLLSAGTRAAWLTHLGHRAYYECKQGFAPTIVVTLCLSLLLAELLAARAGTIRTSLRAFGTVALLAATGLTLTALGAAPYYPSFAERVLHRRAFEWLTPLLERRTETSIETTLAAGGHRFGGFVTPRWPESSFTNAAFRYPRRSWDEADAIHRDAGFCAFWYAPASLPVGWAYSPAHQQRVAELEGGRTAPCVRFTPDDGSARELALCHRCFRAGDAPAPFRASWPIADETIAYQGFHDLEREGSEQWRWTNGDGRLRLAGGWPQGRDCELIVHAHVPRSLDVWLDDRRLDEEEPGRYPLPAQGPRRATAELRLRSPTFRPGPEDERDLGVLLHGVVIECQPR